MSHSPSLPDRPRLDIDPELPAGERLAALEAHYQKVAEINAELDAQLESATDRRDDLHERVDRLERENRALKSASLYLATVEEVVDDEIVLKQHGNNQEILTDLPNQLQGTLDAGDRVAVNDSFTVQRLLDGETDARAQAMQITHSPDATFDDIGGLEAELREVREVVEDPLLRPELFETVGIDPPAGVLLYGPPGTGKTLMAKAVANETDATFIRLAGSELVQKFIGEGASLVRDLFQLANEHEPAVVFIDEIDAIASKRTESKTSGDAEVQRTMMQLLSEMDGFEERGEVQLVAATNRFDMLDEAILRPGRFDRLIEVEAPNRDGRERIFEIHTRDMNLADGVSLSRLADDADGFTGADIRAVCTEAGMFAIRDDRTEVTMTDFRQALEKLDAGDAVTEDHPVYMY